MAQGVGDQWTTRSGRYWLNGYEGSGPGVPALSDPQKVQLRCSLFHWKAARCQPRAGFLGSWTDAVGQYAYLTPVRSLVSSALTPSGGLLS